MEDDVKDVLVALGAKVTPENVKTLRKFGIRQWNDGFEEGLVEGEEE